MKKSIERLLATKADFVITLIRVTLGVVIFAHGAQKALGWFGGYGFEGTMGFFTGKMGLPSVVAFLVIAIEFAGALALIAGAGGRLMAVGIFTVMLGAVLTSHLDHGFFMNWGGAQKGEGFEYHLLTLAMAATVIVRGSGAFSVDRWLHARLAEHTERKVVEARPIEA